MKSTLPSLRRVGAVAVAGTLVASGLLGAPTRATPAASASPEAATSLAERLGDRTAGVYADHNDTMIITVTDETTARQVRTEGATPKLVTRSAAQLRAATAELEQSAKIPGTAWWTDPATNQVVLSIDSTITGDKLTQVQKAAARTNGAVRIEARAGALSTDVIGGEGIWNHRYRCSLGFNVKTSPNSYYFLTAGHCITGTENWYGNSSRTELIGPALHKSFPGDDYGIVYSQNGKQDYGHVKVGNSWRDITASGDAYVGQDVTRTGSTTGTQSGTVVAINATANYAVGPVYGLVVTTICSAGGDSGGPIFAGNTALAIHSGSQGGGCPNDNARGFHQPVGEALAAYGVYAY